MYTQKWEKKSWYKTQYSLLNRKKYTILFAYYSIIIVILDETNLLAGIAHVLQIGMSRKAFVIDYDKKNFDVVKMYKWPEAL